VSFTTLMALTGVAVEVQRGLDFALLQPGEARTATLLAAHELKGFPAWMPLLIRAHRQVVHAALRDTIANEWRCAIESHGVLRFAPWEPGEVSELIKEIALELATQGAPAHPRTINYASNAILTSGTDSEGAALLAERMTKTSIGSPSACAEWLRLWAHTAPIEAAAWVTSLRTASPALFEDLVFRVAAMLGQDLDRNSGRVHSTFATDGVKAWLPLLVRVVRPSDDIEHVGAHMVGERDNAQALREKCLSAIVAEGSLASCAVLTQLRDANLRTPFGEEIERAFAAHEKQATENAAEPWSIESILDFEHGRTTTPTSPAGLYSLVRRHLRQIGESQEVGDFSHRELFAPREPQDEKKSTRVELGVQRWVSATLQLLARGVYAVQREEEVQDENSVDICARIPGLSRLPIEIKPIGCYTEKQLQATIRDQLLGKYMRPREVTHGILLLVQMSDRKHQVGELPSATYKEMHAALSEFAQGFAVSHGKTIAVESISLVQPERSATAKPLTNKRILNV